MSHILTSLLAMLTAGTMVVGTSLERAAPHNSENSMLLLANREWTISNEYYPVVRMTDMTGQVRRLRDEAATAMEQMVAACKQEIGVTLISVSGYRDYDKQERIYKRKLKSVKGDVEKADEYVARPGASEHQTGLAMDIGQRNKDSSNLGASFGKTKGGIWVRENCWRFGFILRYDQGWEEITGYEYEPWHLRYVGIEHARNIHNTPIPLEVYLLQYRADIIMAMVRKDSE